MVPHGFRFNPTDEELIQILDRKAFAQEMPLNFIIHTNIYDHEPQDLPWDEDAGIGKDERYYYCKKENDSREVVGKGWWKATSHVKKVYIDENLVGHKRPLTFYRYRDHHKNRNNAIKTNWIMHEFSLLSKTTEWRLCKIKYKGRPSIQEEMENIRQQHSSRNYDFEVGNSSTSQSDSSGQVQQNDNPLPAVNSTMPTHNNNWNMDLYLPQPSYGDPYPPKTIPPTDYYFNQHYSELIEEQIPSLWPWQN